MVNKRTSWCMVFVALYPNADVMNFVHQSMWAQKSFFGVQPFFCSQFFYSQKRKRNIFNCDYNFKGV